MPHPSPLQPSRTKRLASALLGVVALAICAGEPARAAGPAPAGGSALQLGLFQKEADAWSAWQTMQRRKPDLATGLTPAVVTLGGGVALRATPGPGGNAATLCRRFLGAGFGCVVVDKGTAATAATAAAPPPPAAAPAAPVGTRTEVAAAVPPAVPPAAAPVPAARPTPGVIPVALPAAPPVRATSADSTAADPASPSVLDGIYTYNDEQRTTMVEIEKRARKRGRLGAVVPDTDLDVQPAVLTKRGWNLCALTFDDGPHRTVTRQILETLNKEKIPATYFPIGRVAAQHGDIIRDFIASGHEIGNHSQTHADLRALPPEAQRFEIAEANRILRSLGANPVLFRPPYGRYTLDLLAITREERMSPVLWNVDTRDWQVRDPDKIVQHVKTDAGTGSVILLHSTYPSTANALPRIISTLRAKGCEFVTLSEWIASMRNLAAPMMVNAAEPVVSARASIGGSQN